MVAVERYERLLAEVKVQDVQGLGLLYKGGPPPRPRRVLRKILCPGLYACLTRKGGDLACMGSVSQWNRNAWAQRRFLVRRRQWKTHQDTGLPLLGELLDDGPVLELLQDFLLTSPSSLISAEMASSRTSSGIYISETRFLRLSFVEERFISRTQ